MSDLKEKEALAGTEEEKASLKVEDTSADGSLPAYEAVEDGNLANDSAFDNSRARFISNSHEKGDGATPDVYVDVEGKTKIEENFVGLTKEELMKYAEDPYWKKVRLALLIIFWIGWFGMLVAAIVIIVVAPKCPPRPNLDWWQTSAIYQVYPKSFKDSNGDGVGDLKGVHDKLDYLQGKDDSLNVSALWLNPIYPHGGFDNGYDVTDYTNISTEFGTLEEFESLRVALHKRGMKVIMDFIPNHSSDKHPWFNMSRSKDPKYKDYYVWHAGQNGGPPNNWQSVFGGPAWTKDVERQEYYYHQFSKEQPDLNMRNPDVQKEMEGILKFWMNKGVDGFRIDAISHLFECTNMTDESKKDPSGDLSYENMDHTCTQFQPETYEIVTKWRALLDAHSKEFDKVEFMMVETYGTPNQTAQFFNYDGKPGAHMPTNMELVQVDEKCEAQCIYSKITSWASVAETHNIWSNWQIGNHDSSRVVSRFDGKRTMINNMNMLLLTLPGTSLTYYGEEIGMHDIVLAGEKRLQYRSPLQWSSERFAGFTDGNKTWLPLPADYPHYNIKTQKAHGGGVSNLEVYYKLIKLRNEPSFQWGTLKIGYTGNVLFYVRQAVGFPGYLVAMNFGPNLSTVDFVTNAPAEATIPAEGEVVANTANFPNSGSDFDLGVKADLTNLILDVGQGVVFKWKPEDLEKKEL